jgi:hypothetical protein
MAADTYTMPTRVRCQARLQSRGVIKPGELPSALAELIE